MALRDLINSAAKSSGIDPDLLARIVRIESGNDPYARTGSYHGLLQLSQPEFQRFNPTGDIYDPAANLNAGAAKLAQEIATFRQNYGRDPTPTDIYMTHQQGAGRLRSPYSQSRRRGMAQYGLDWGGPTEGRLLGQKGNMGKHP